jgi:hypothetical protein
MMDGWGVLLGILSDIFCLYILGLVYPNLSYIVFSFIHSIL